MAIQNVIGDSFAALLGFNSQWWRVEVINGGFGMVLMVLKKLQDA
jgi:hypothetical protein